MQPVAVGGLHEHIVRLADIGGVLDDGLVQVADIAGKHQLGGSVALGDPQLDAGGAQQVAHIHEPHLNTRSQLNALFVVHTHEQLHGRLGVLHGIHRLHRLGTLRFFHSASNSWMWAESRSMIPHSSTVGLVA